MKYKAIITDDQSVKYNEQQSVTLEFEDANMEKIMAACETVLLFGENKPSVLVWRL